MRSRNVRSSLSTLVCTVTTTFFSRGSKRRMTRSISRRVRSRSAGTLMFSPVKSGIPYSTNDSLSSRKAGGVALAPPTGVQQILQVTANVTASADEDPGRPMRKRRLPIGEGPSSSRSMTELTSRRLLSLLLMCCAGACESARHPADADQRRGRKRNPANRQKRFVLLSDEKSALADARDWSAGDLTPVRPATKPHFRILAAVRSVIQDRHVDERIWSFPDDYLRLPPQQIAEILRRLELQCFDPLPADPVVLSGARQHLQKRTPSNHPRLARSANGSPSHSPERGCRSCSAWRSRSPASLARSLAKGDRRAQMQLQDVGSTSFMNSGRTARLRRRLVLAVSARMSCR